MCISGCCKVWLVLLNIIALSLNPGVMSVEKRPSSLYLDLKSLGELFREVDKEEKGYIEFEGLQEMISNMNEFDPSMAKELMEKLDRDRDGKVSF